MKKIEALKNKETGDIDRVIYHHERIEVNEELGRYDIYDSSGELIEMFALRFCELSTCLLIEESELGEKLKWIEERIRNPKNNESKFDAGFLRGQAFEIEELLNSLTK